jgi:periplasmic divalent cation tolerance protein
MIIVYVTCKDKKEGREIAVSLLKKRMIACANIFPIQSIYRWKGKLVDEKEVVILAKSTKNKFQEMEKEVRKLHSYEVPCIEMFETKANKDYESWVKGELK